MECARAALAQVSHARPPAVIGLIVALFAIDPVPLLPLARVFQVLCERYPVLTLLTFHAPPTLVALLLSLAGLGVLVAVGMKVVALVQTQCYNKQLRRGATPPPARLARLATALGNADRTTYLAWAQPAACCYGFRDPRIALTQGLVTRLDDADLTAVVAHERQHRRRHDPLRYLALHALSAGGFMFPVAPSLRQRQEARIELAADRAALAVVPRGALAGALLAVIHAPRLPVAGVASLTAPEARIAHLSGHAVLPELPARLVVASLGFTGVILVAATTLARTADLVAMVCAYCAGRV